jgi:hypothetical protein
MKQLAENAGELLPQDEADGGKKRGRGRPKKDMRLVDALHQSWQGKVRKGRIYLMMPYRRANTL